MKKIENISKEKIRTKGVQSLPNTPNTVSYGSKGLSAEELKYQFDRVAYLIAEKVNEIVEILNDGTLGDYIPMNDPDTQVENLSALLTSISNGGAARMMQVYEDISEETLYSLQTVLYRISEKISKLTEGDTVTTVTQAAETHTIDLPVSAWVAVEDRYFITAPIEGLKEHDVVIPRVSHAELWNAFDLKVEMADGSITTSVNSIPAEDAVMVIAVLKTIGGEG